MPEFSAPPSEFEGSELMDVDSIEFLSSESEEDHDDGPSLLEEVESEPILGQGDDNSKAEISVSSPASDVESGTASTSSKMRAKSRQVVTSNSIFTSRAAAESYVSVGGGGGGGRGDVLLFCV